MEQLPWSQTNFQDSELKEEAHVTHLWLYPSAWIGQKQIQPE